MLQNYNTESNIAAYNFVCIQCKHVRSFIPRGCNFINCHNLFLPRDLISSISNENDYNLDQPYDDIYFSLVFHSCSSCRYDFHEKWKHSSQVSTYTDL